MIKKVTSDTQVLELHDVLELLPKRKDNSHKGSHGHLVIVAGDEGYGGAGILCSESALKSGAGIVHLLTREKYVPASLTRNPEIIACGGEKAQDLEPYFPLADALICGPGMFKNFWSEQLLFKLLQHARATQLKLVLDAGALRLLCDKPFSAMELSNKLVITPHPGEAAALLGTTIEDVQGDRLGAAKELHDQFHAVVVLKGHATIVLDESNAFICETGGSELAVAGTGDVLCGVIGSLLAQGLSPINAAKVGVALHSNAGNYFYKKTGSIGLTASELIEPIRQFINKQL